MKIEIKGWFAKWLVTGGIFIATAVFLDILPGNLPVSLGVLAWFSLLGGIGLVCAAIVLYLMDLRDKEGF